jgi:cell division protein FtsB
VKFGLWRLLRFSTQRYDRLLADLAELNAGLAERLVAAEDEISKLRAEVDDLRQDRP